MIRKWLIGGGLLDDVQEVSVDDGHCRGLHDGYVIDGPVAKDDRGNGYRNIAVGMFIPVKSCNVQSVQVSEFDDLRRKLLLVCQ